MDYCTQRNPKKTYVERTFEVRVTQKHTQNGREIIIHRISDGTNTYSSCIEGNKLQNNLNVGDIVKADVRW